MTEAVVALDQGSGSSRALAFDPKGRVLARSQVSLGSRAPRPGWVEHDALEIARSQELALDAVLRRLGPRVKVVAVGLASQRSTVVLWDRSNGRPVAPALSWQDGRAASIVEPLHDRQAEAHERTGLYLTPYYSAAKIRWALDNIPAARAAARKGTLAAGPVAAWLVWRLTRGEALACDPTLAQRMMLYNIRDLAWDDAMLGLFGIPRSCLPEVRPSAGDWGPLRRGGLSLPLRAVLGDQQAAALRLGGSEEGVGILNYGTGAFFLLNTGTGQHRVAGLLTSVAWSREGRGCRYFQEGTVHAAGTSFQWLKDNLGLLPSAEKADASCRRARGRVLALPAIGGLGAPRWDYQTATTIMGLTTSSRPADIVRAVADGIAYLVADIVAAVRAAGLTVGALKASGGLSHMGYLLQRQADVLQVPITRVRESEATAAGAAFMAAQAAGLPWAARLAVSRQDRLFKPRLPAAEAQRLQQAWRLFVETQAKLSRELKRLGAL